MILLLVIDLIENPVEDEDIFDWNNNDKYIC